MGRLAVILFTLSLGLISCRDQSESNFKTKDRAYTTIVPQSETGEIPNPEPGSGSDGGTAFQGPPGLQGPQGEVGPQGSMGPMGPMGPQGIAGAQGPMGAPGAAGPEGPAGPKGEVGARGENGRDGENGKDGSDGENGKDGKDGSAILAGMFNPPDSEGKDDDLYFDQSSGEVYKKVEGAWQFLSSLMGEKGEQGDRGEQGEQGDRGEQGIQGFQGEQGAQGERGEVGRQGLQGAQGFGAGIVSRPATTCPARSNGGAQFTTFQDRDNDSQLDQDEVVTSISVVCGGLAGKNGKDGKDGESSRISVSLAEACQCPAGGYVITTQDGDDSPTSVPVCHGTQGLRGLQGPAGAPGSTVTPVKFCASDNSLFPEYGLKIGDDIFAVYWGTAPYSPREDTAFLAKVIPGSYRSTGGNGCYFYVDSQNRITSR